MCANYIIPFIIGIFVGQEIKEIPRVKPYLEAIVKKIIQVGKEIISNAQETSVNNINNIQYRDKEQVSKDTTGETFFNWIKK
jgi:hypothetical protein